MTIDLRFGDCFTRMGGSWISNDRIILCEAGAWWCPCLVVIFRPLEVMVSFPIWYKRTLFFHFSRCRSFVRLFGGKRSA
jgi:hypothetical protein